MFKKGLLLMTFFAVMAPMVAFSYTLTTRINTLSGQLQVNAYVAQTTAGSVMRSIANGTNVNVVIAPASGYVISRIQQGTTYLTVTPAGQTVNIPTTNTASQTINVWFDKQLVSVTASGGNGGTVAPAGTLNLQAGSTKSYTFTPDTGNNVVAITGLSGLTATVTPAVPAAIDTPVTVVLTVPATAVTMTGSFVNVVANAGNQTTALVNSGNVTLNGSASTGATTYAWAQTAGPAVTITNASLASATIPSTTAGSYQFQLVASNGAASSTDYVSVVVTTSLAAAAKNQCINCHITAGVGGAGVAQTVFNNWSTSGHKTNAHGPGMCYGCHVGANTGGHPGTVSACAGCHGATVNHTAKATAGAVGTGCSVCHVGSRILGNDAHSMEEGCVDCHAVPLNAGSAYVQDNNGVRAITGEFQQWSHHIINSTDNSVLPQNAQCVVCHMEGKGTPYGVHIDSTYHMADAKIHLRDCNTGLSQSQSTGGEFIWDPATPNHTAMDQFCMSCHNAAGAVSAPIPAGTVRTASPLNPFGDLIQNNYDGLSRGAVVAVYDQFDPSNTSHHAVRAARYTASTAGTPGSPGSLIPAFANISANNAAAPAPQTGVNLRYQNGTSYVGTMSDTGKFITTYKPLVDNNAAFAPLADNSQLHCGDCHTVGQWAGRGTAAFQAYSAAFGAGVTKYYKTAIGAHGSGNEYMLRNAAGDNNLQPAMLVCYNCHAASLYGSGSSSTTTGLKIVTSGMGPNGPQLNGVTLPGGKAPLVSWTLYNYTGARINTGFYQGFGLLNNNAQQRTANGGVASSVTTTAHDGVAGTLGGVHCNDDQNNTAGLTGMARINAKPLAAATFNGYTSGKYSSGTGGGNAFGIKCANCHNSGDGTNKGYGGIHGNAFRVDNTATVINNAAYTTYSSTTAGTGTGTTWATTTHQPYRFLPGLGNFRYNGGSDWTLSKFAISGRGGCYTLNGIGNNAGPTKVKGASVGRFTGANMVADDNGLLGTWGSCTEHASNDHIPTRNVLRPTNY
jgi:hypothetical protein